MLIEKDMIDREGFRANVGIVLINSEGKVLWGKRAGQADAWQFPQGGLQFKESLEECLFRELQEELGLKPEDVKILHRLRHWIYYRLPKKYLRYDSRPFCIGQKQKWFLLKLIGPESHIQLDANSPPEFDQWRWVEYWYPINHVIEFKKHVYTEVLKNFSSFVTQEASSCGTCQT